MVYGKIFSHLKGIHPAAGVVLPGSQEVEKISLDLFRTWRWIRSGLNQ